MTFLYAMMSKPAARCRHMPKAGSAAAILNRQVHVNGCKMQACYENCIYRGNE